MAIIVRTVSDLIAELQKLDGGTIPISHEPPFTGVQIVPQEDGKVYIASLWNSDEGRAYRAARKHQQAQDLRLMAGIYVYGERE